MMVVALIWKTVPESHSSFDSSKSLLVSSSTLKMEAVCFSETSGPLRTMRRFNPQDRIHSHRHEYLQSNSFGILRLFRYFYYAASQELGFTHIYRL
jgi:hypothetical protein